MGWQPPHKTNPQMEGLCVFVCAFNKSSCTIDGLVRESDFTHGAQLPGKDSKELCSLSPNPDRLKQLLSVSFFDGTVELMMEEGGVFISISSVKHPCFTDSTLMIGDFC